MGNKLPYDGEVYDFGQILSLAESLNLGDFSLQELHWENDIVKFFGREIVTRRQIVSYADKGLTYHYSGHIRQTLPWHPKVLYLKQSIEKISNASFNSCLLNLYPDGNTGMSYQRDNNERELGKYPKIAILSLGATRILRFRHLESHELIRIPLISGQLILMQDSAQIHWQHEVQKSKKISKPRISLTFRKILY